MRDPGGDPFFENLNAPGGGDASCANMPGFRPAPDCAIRQPKNG